jgi:hypothetical protein
MEELLASHQKSDLASILNIYLPKVIYNSVWCSMNEHIIYHSFNLYVYIINLQLPGT